MQKYWHRPVKVLHNYLNNLHDSHFGGDIQ